MKPWKLFVLILILASLILLACATWFNWNSWEPLRSIRTRQKESPIYTRHPGEQLPLLSQFSTIGALIATYLSGILVLFVFPIQIKRMEAALSTSKKGTLLIAVQGLLVAMLTLAIAVGSSLAMGTFPLSIFLGSILFLSGFTGIITIGYTLGHFLLKRADWNDVSPLASLLLGLLIFFSVTRIPYLGNVIAPVFICLGIGVVFTTRFGTGRAWSLAPLRED